MPGSLEAAEQLAGSGIEAAVLDPRSIVPLDRGVAARYANAVSATLG